MLFIQINKIADNLSSNLGQFLLRLASPCGGAHGWWRTKLKSMVIVKTCQWHALRHSNIGTTRERVISK